MQAVLKRLELHPDPSTLPADAAAFSLHVRMIVGPSDSPGEESFDVTVCTPEWLAEACRKAGGIYNARHLGGGVRASGTTRLLGVRGLPALTAH